MRRARASNVPELVPRGRGYPRWVRGLWRIFLRIRFHLLHKSRFNRLALVEIAGHPILVLPDVFHPGLLRTGRFLAECVGSDLIPEAAEVLDMGCGSGIGAVAAARCSRRVTAVDINPEAVRCARINAWLNRAEDRIEVLQSDLFSALEERRFDVVLFNPPFFRGKPDGLLDAAWRGTDTLERFAEQLPRHLRPDGSALIAFSTDGDVTGLLAAFRSQRLSVEVIRELDLMNEILILYRIRGNEPTAE